MNSMTGYGRADDRSEKYELTIEIKTVNNRYCDISLKLPHAFNCIEDKIRRRIKERIARGRAEVSIRFSQYGTQSRSISYDAKLAGAYVKVLNNMMRLNTMIDESISVDQIARFPDVIRTEELPADAQELWTIVEPVLNTALDMLTDARAQEGAALYSDITEKLSRVQMMTEAIKKLQPEAFAHSREALKLRLAEYTAEIPVDESRFLTEIAVMADKLAIDEEITRLESHLNRLGDICNIQEDAVGRKLDFQLQEINREINTIGSKTDSIDIANHVVDLKSEVEKIREQVQNIE